MNIRPIVPSQYLTAAAELMREHWAETEREFYPDGPKPQRQLYEALEKQTIAFGAFEDELLVGYVVAFIYDHIHYGIPCVQHDVLFVHKDYRKGSLGLKLVAAIENEAKARGAYLVAWHAKPQSAFEMLLVHRKYSQQDSVYTRRL